MSVSAQLRLAVRKVVCVEDNKFGEEAGPQPRHTGPHHPAPVMAHKDHALQVQVRSRSNIPKFTYLSLEVGHHYSVVRTQPGITLVHTND